MRPPILKDDSIWNSPPCKGTHFLERFFSSKQKAELPPPATKKPGAASLNVNCTVIAARVLSGDIPPIHDGREKQRVLFFSRHRWRMAQTAASYALVAVIAVMLLLWVSRVCWRVARRACLLRAENLKKTPGSPHNLVIVPTVEYSLQPTHNMLPLVVTEQMSTPYISQQKSKDISSSLCLSYYLTKKHTQLYNTLLREGRKYPSSPATAIFFTKVGLQLHFGWAHAHPGNRLSNLKILARYL